MFKNRKHPRFPQLQTSLFVILLILSLDLITKVAALTFAPVNAFTPIDDDPIITLAINSSKSPIGEYRDKDEPRPSIALLLPGAVGFIAVIFTLRYVDSRSDFATKFGYSFLLIFFLFLIYIFCASLQDFFPASAPLHFLGHFLSVAATGLWWISLTRNKTLTIAFVLIYGGALGNLINVIYYPFGAIDFIDYGSAIINLADISIHIGRFLFFSWLGSIAIVTVLSKLFKDNAFLLKSELRLLSYYN